MKPLRAIILLALLGVFCADAWAQRRWGFRDRDERERNPYSMERGDVPTWDLDADLPGDCFTFARLEFRSWTQRRSWTWYTDFRDSDLNMSYRLHTLTALRVHPEGVTFPIDDPRLFDYPFTFMSGVGGWELNDDEAAILRRYLLNGGFLMIDDFHGREQWDYFHKQLRKVFPDREPREVALEHPIFHIVFDLKERHQVPNLSIGTQFRGERTWEVSDWKEVNYCAIYDDRDRMCVFIAHNSDLGDGWEEERTDPFYFQMFSEPRAFPIGINVIMYALTH